MRRRTWNVAVAALLLTASEVSAQQSATLSLDSLLGTQIQAASKYLQTSAQAPASVTIITADDIRAHRYRSLLEVLETVRGFHVSNDRNYPLVGIRGFSRPSDYNNRILVLVDGHALNDQTWGGTPVGSDLPINLDAVERVEVIRGPGSALYGTNAMFAVINVVTKTGAQLDGIRASVSAGTGAAREVTVAGGRAIGVRGSVAGSAIVTRSDGGTLIFPELADDNGGISRNKDWEESVGALASGTFGSFGAKFGYRKRSKGIPTGAFGTLLGDERAESTDETLWGEISARRESGGVFGIGVRLYGDRYEYSGVYPSAPGPAYRDGGGSAAIGAEVIANWDPVSRDRVTFGAEYRRAMRADYFEVQATGEETSDDAPFSLASIFAENALHVSSKVDLITGIRFERRSSRQDAVAPRLALLVTPGRLTTLKLLYGQAYRTPSAAEADITTSYYTRNPALRAERIATTEIELAHQLSAPLLVTASAFHYRVRNLIDQQVTDDDGVEFRNVARAKATGLELQADFMPEGLLSAHASYSAQRTRGEDAGQPLTNSPTQIAHVSVSAGSATAWRATAAVRYETGRLTLAGTSTDAFVRTDVNVAYSFASAGLPSWARAVGISMRVTNLFDTDYAVPGGIEHTQSSIPQPGRTLTLRIDWGR